MLIRDIMDTEQGLSSDQIKRYSRAFHRFDTDRDGNINGKDLGKILRFIGHNPTEAEIQEMISTADKDGTGTLDIIEFLQMMKEKIRDQNKEEEITEAFKVFDIVSGDCECVKYCQVNYNSRIVMVILTEKSWG